MLRRKSDYRSVNVDRIPVTGDFLPARDVRYKGGWQIPHAEDVAYLLEMNCERFGIKSNNYNFYDDVYMMPNSYTLWQSISILANNLRWQNTFVDPDYEFEPVYGAQTDSLDDVYPDAFSMEPATKAGDFQGWNLARLCPMSADVLRRGFYDYQRLVRFSENPRETESGSSELTSERWYTRNGAWVKIPTTQQYSSFYKYYWSARGNNYNDADHWQSRKYISSGTGSVSLDFGNTYLRTDYIESVVAFVCVKTFFSDQDVDIYVEVAKDIIPFACTGRGSRWELPATAISIATAKAALARNGIDETPPGIEHPPDEYPSSGVTQIYKNAAASMSVIGAVCKFNFPSDFSELGWNWAPKTNVNC